MPRSGIRIVVAGALLSGCFSLWVFAQPPGPSGDKAAIRRVVLRGEKATRALEATHAGTLVRFEPKAFEQALLRRTEQAKRPTLRPHLTTARYRARYVTVPDGDGYLSGTAEWVVRHPGDGPSQMTLSGLQLALRQAKWSDGQDAILYRTPSDPHPVLHIPASGDRSLVAEWSVAGVPEPGEIRFDLLVPAAPVASIDLDLPANLVPVLPQSEALLSGPYPAGEGEAQWRIAFAGAERLEVVLRTIGDVQPSLLARVNSVQTLSAGAGTARCEVHVESSRTGFTSLQFGHDAGFTVTSVRVNNLAGWNEVNPADGGRGLVVRLREPTRSANLIITGALEVPLHERWKSPGLWLVDGVQRAESVQLLINPEVRMSDWQPGGYRLIRAERGSDQVHVLEAVPGLLPDNQLKPVRPSFVPVPVDSYSWRAVQRSTWAVRAREQQWQVETTLSGMPPALIRFRLPSGWQVDRVQVGDRDLSWSIVEGPSRSLHVDVGPQERSGAIQVRLKRDGRSPAGREVALPDLYPEGAAGRSGLLTLRVDPSLNVSASDPVGSSPADQPVSEPEDILRTLTNEPLTGWVMVWPRSTRHQAVLESVIRRSPNRTVVEASLALEPVGGGLDELVCWTPTAVQEPWAWKDTDGRKVADMVRAPDAAIRGWVLAGSGPHPLATVATAAALSVRGGYWWRIRFSPAVSRPTVLHSTYQTDPEGPAEGLPLVWLPGLAFRGTARLLVYPEATGPEIAMPPDPQPQATERYFRYGPEGLEEWSDRRAERSPPEVGAARLVTSVRADGSRAACLQFRIRHWAAGRVPVTLPTGAANVVITVAGRRVPHAWDTDRRDLTCQIPVPWQANWLWVDVRYDLLDPVAWFVLRATSPLPTGPFSPDEVRCFWQVDPAWRPVQRQAFHPVPGTTSRQVGMPLPDPRSWLIPRTVSIAPGQSNDLQRQGLIPSLRAHFPEGDLILDTRAMQLAGVPLSDEFEAARVSVQLRDRGLVVFRTDQGNVLTSPAEIMRWYRQAEWTAVLPADVSDALEAAQRHGQDTTGRFMRVDRSPPITDMGGDALQAPPGWLILESSRSDSSGPTLYHGVRLTLICWAISLLTVVLGAGLGRRRRWTVLVPWGLAAVGVTLVLAIPGAGEGLASPFLCGALLGSFMNVLHRPRQPENTPSTMQPAVPVPGILASIALLAGLGIAAEPAAEVFILEERPGEASAVLVAPDNLERLGLPRPPPPVVITAARYAGVIGDGVCRFRASFRVFAFRDDPSRLFVALPGVRFRSVSLDGAEARELEIAADGLRLGMRGKGVHTLDLEFSVPITEVGGDREVKIFVPEVPVTQAVIEAPIGATGIRTGGWRGGSQVKRELKASAIQGEPGPTGVLAIRWSEAGDRAPTIRAREAAVWHLTPGFASLSAVVEYRVAGSSVQELQLAVPAAATVSRLALRTEAAGSMMPVQIRDWTVTPLEGPRQRLTIGLNIPTSGRLLLNLEMAQNRPLTTQASLLFPRVIGATEHEGHAAIELLGLEAMGSLAPKGMEDFPVDRFSPGVWSTLDGTPYPRRVSRAYRFTGSGPGSLEVPVREVLPPRTVSESLTWWVEPNRLTLSAESRWQGAALTLLEWVLPEDVRISEVACPNLANWSQTGRRVQVWLARPLPEVTVGWRATRGRGMPAGQRATVPSVEYPTYVQLASEVRVRPTNGWVLTAVANRPQGSQLPATAPGELAWKGPTPQPVSVIAVPPPTQVELPATTTIRRERDQAVVTIRLGLDSLPTNRPYVLKLGLKDTADAEVACTAAPEAIVAEAGRPVNGRWWSVGLPAARTAGAAVVITVVRPLSGMRPMTVPRLTAGFGPGAPARLQESVVLAGDGLGWSETEGLIRAGAREWKPTHPGWRARVAESAGLYQEERARILNAEFMTWKQGSTWQARGRYWLAVPQDMTLQVVPPGDARINRFEVDGHLRRHEGLPLPIRVDPESKWVDLCWSSPRPALVAPTLHTGGSPIPISTGAWTIFEPPGFRLVDVAEPAHERAIPTEVERTRSSLEEPSAPNPGTPRRFPTRAGESLDLHLVPVAPPRLWWRPVIAVPLLILVGGFTLVWGHKIDLAQLAVLGIITPLLIGPAAAILGVIPLAALAWWARMRARQGRAPLARDEGAVGTS